MDGLDGAQIFRLNLKLSTDTLKAAAPDLEKIGIEPKEFFVLDGLEERPYPAELARHLSMPKPTITAYLKSLQGSGLIGRTIDAQDLRRHRIELTEAGRETLSRARAILTSRYDERLVRLSKQERAQFAMLLRKLCE